MDCQKGCKGRNTHLDTCVLGECWGCRPASALNGLLVCQRCVDSLDESLNKLNQMLPELDSRMVRSNDYRLRDRVTGSPEIGLVLNDNILQLKTSVRDWVVFVYRVIVTEREILNPPADNSTTELIRFARHHHLWLCAHELAADFVIDAASMLRSVMNGAFPPSRKKVAIPSGKCIHEVDGGLCGGQLSAILRGGGEKLPSQIICQSDASHCVTTSEWIGLGKRLRELAEV